MTEYDIFKQVTEPYEKVFDIIRVVDPIARKSITLEEDKLIYRNIDCYAFWETSEMCKECIAEKALKENKTFVKIQYDMEKMHIFFATPVKIQGKAMVIELLKDVTGNLLFETVDRENEHEIRNITNDINSILLKDSFTNLYNRRYMNKMLPVEIARSNESNQYLTIVMVDIDDFKSINDTYGHYVGDLVIKKFSDVMIESIRNETDWIARYGGDEFLICLHNVNDKQAGKIVERIRKEVENMTVKADDILIKVTASFGLVTIKDTTLESDDLIKLADSKLYEAKKQGRNKVVQ
jgi:diguanylate cyclase (GGDEF)-like protein